MSFINISKSSPKIFICYRRSGEGSGFGGRIADKLVKHFGKSKCFRDVEEIEAGADFVESIKHAMSICEVLIVVIGPDWTTMTDEINVPKIQGEHDFVRLEVQSGLERNIRVIPVLVGGAKVPSEKDLPDEIKSLARRQTHEITDHRWDYDSNQLIKAIENMGIRGKSPKEKEARKRNVKIGATVILTALVFILGMSLWNKFKPVKNMSQPEEVSQSEEQSKATDSLKLNNITNTEKATSFTPVKKDIDNSPVIDKEVKKPQSFNYNAEREAIKKTIMKAAEISSYAFRYLNPNSLSQVYTGSALNEQRTDLASYMADGRYLISKLEYQDINDLDIYEKNKALYAQAEIEETWSAHLHLKDLCVYHYNSVVLSSTVFLQKTGGGWKINLEKENDDDPIGIECGEYFCNGIIQ